MTESNPDAFISYSREDSEFALRLAQDLKAAGARVWLDQLDIEPGTAWDNAVEDALMAAPRMLLILSPSSAHSSSVRNEISFALEQGKIIIPVQFKDCVVPLQLQRNQRIDCRTDYACGLASLLLHLHVHPAAAVTLENAAQATARPPVDPPPGNAAARPQRDSQDNRPLQQATTPARGTPLPEPNAAPVFRPAASLAQGNSPAQAAALPFAGEIQKRPTALPLWAKIGLVLGGSFLSGCVGSGFAGGIAEGDHNLLTDSITILIICSLIGLFLRWTHKWVQMKWFSMFCAPAFLIGFLIPNTTPDHPHPSFWLAIEGVIAVGLVAIRWK